MDENLKKQLNTTKDKADIILNLDDNNIIIIECKTIKESGYNKFSSVSRQIKSYVKLAENKGYNVVKSLLVAPDFSDEFVNECDLEFEINLSLITSKSLLNILDSFKVCKLKQLPYQLLMKDVLIKEERIIKAILITLMFLKPYCIYNQTKNLLAFIENSEYNHYSFVF